MKINIRSIAAFSDISEKSLQLIESCATYSNFSMGEPICIPDVIPNKVLILLSGKARLIHYENNEQYSSSILSNNDFLGLASILRAEGCENLAASNDVICMAMPDNILIQLYNEDSKFKNWCNQTIQSAEIYKLSKIFLEKFVKTELRIEQLFKLFSEHLTLQVIKNGNELKITNDFINIVGSANIIGKNIGDPINKNEVINTRGPFEARIFSMPNKIYEKLLLNKASKKNIDLIKESNTSEIELRNSKHELYESKEEVGQYRADKKTKLIRARGVVRESLACLQIISSELELPYRGDAIEKILKDTIKRNKKPNLQLMGGITSMMGLHPSLTKVTSNKGDRLPLNSLITWGESFAIVRDSRPNNLKLFSPSDGIINLNSDDFTEIFETGYIELLIIEKHEQTPETNFGLKWLLPSINRYKGTLLQVLLASFVVQLFGLANPLMIQVIIDKVISQRSLDTLQILGIALVVVTILGGIISSLRTFLFTETTNRIDTRLASSVIDHLLRLPLNYFDRRPVGELGSRIAELEKIRDFLTGQALTTILDAVFSLIYIIVMVIYSWLLTAIALGVVPIQVLLTLIGTPLIRGQIREVAQENAKTQSHLVEVLTGIQTVKAQNVERVSRWKWQELYGKYISKTFQKTITGTALNETSKVLQQLSQLLVLWIGASLVLNGQLTLGQLIAFRIISGYVTQPLLRLSSIWQNIQELRVSFERLADVVDTPEETTEADRAKIPLPLIEGSVEFRKVSFRFERDQTKVLSSINLNIEKGKFVGVVGQSGSGKSTLMKLLPRLYQPTEGKILIDGYDINKVELYSLRRQVGIVPQEPLLFAGTINANISLTEPDASSDDIVNAARMANAHDFIMNLENGYSTKIGERGAGLSGGQKQRIAIARTLLSNPRLLILDEATSALDYSTESKVCEYLRNSSQNKTVFFITHRLTTVKNADLIIMMDSGTIVETGTHQDLMNLKGRYYALYQQQDES